MPKSREYSLLVSFLDNGWVVKQFNSHEVTLIPEDRSGRDDRMPVVQSTST